MLDIQMERLAFRPWALDDFDEIAAFFAVEENARYVGGVKAPEQAWRSLATYLGHYQLMGYSYLALTERDGGALVGTVGLWNSEPWPEPELGYWLLPRAQGKGYGVEAGIAVRKHALEVLNLPSLVSYIDPSNEPSKKLARRLGARLDGVIELFDFGPHEVYRHR